MSSTKNRGSSSTGEVEYRNRVADISVQTFYLSCHYLFVLKRIHVYIQQLNNPCQSTQHVIKRTDTNEDLVPLGIRVK